MKKITGIGLVSTLLLASGLLAFFLINKGKEVGILTQARQRIDQQKQQSKKSIADQIYPAPYGGEEGKITLKNLDLSRIPGEQELRRAGQLGSPLTPMGSAEPKEIKDPEQRKRQEQDNLLFAKAMDLWNRHKYQDAVQLFQKHRAQFPDSPWAGECELHMGCEAQFNGRWDEAEFNFEWILKQAAKGSDMYQKAKLRRSVLAMEQGQIQLAIDSFKEMLKTEKDWGRKTYAQTWIRQLSSWKNFQAALRNCGSESVAYLCDIGGQAEKAEKLRQRPAKGDHGFTIEELMVVAKEAGLDPLAIRADSQELDKITTPFIAHYRDLHYVVVKKISSETKEVEVYDPRLKHEAKLPRNTFLRQWSGLGVIFSEKVPKGIRLANIEDLKQVGGCCGIPRPECDLGGGGGDGGGGCGGGGDDTCSQGMPIWRVNPINFNLVVQDIPLWYNNERGPNVKILLTYNSQDAINQLRPFGNKWTFNYASYAMEGPGGKVTIVMPDGRRDEYTPSGLNSFTPPSDRPAHQLNKLGEYAYALKTPDGTVYHYAVPEAMEGESTTSLLIKIQDKFGQKLTLEHNDEGALVKIKDALNRETLIFYNPQGYISHINDPFGRQATFQYDENSDLISQSDMGEINYSYTYKLDSYLSSITLPSGKYKFLIEPADEYNDNDIIGDINYPEKGSPMWENYRITITDPLNYSEEYHYDGFASYGWYRNKKQILSASKSKPSYGPKTVFHYGLVEGKGVISSVKYADGSKDVFSDFTSYRKYQQYQDRNGNIQKFTYNNKGNILTFTDARDNTTTYEYAENGKDIIQITDALNKAILKITYSITVGDQPALIENADNKSTGFGYNEFGKLISFTNALGQVASYIYNELQQLTEIKQGSATLGAFTYDPIGRISTATDVLDKTQIYEYDNLNRITKILYSDGTTLENQWGCCRLEQQTDRAGHKTFFFYDVVGNLILTEDAEKHITQFSYDPNGNLIKLTDANGNQTRWEYDGLDRLVKKVYANNSELNYDYDKVGNLIKFTNARGQTMNFGYDQNYNLTNFNGANLPEIAFTYDALNRKKQMVDNQGLTTYGYKPSGQLDFIDGPWDNDTITYAYDELGRSQKRTINSQEVSLHYDELSRIDSRTTALGSFGYSYLSASSGIKQITYPNQQKTIFSYDANNEYRLKEILNQDPSSQTLSKFTYQYDAGGNIVQWSQQQGDNQQVYQFGYDKTDQLKSALLKEPNTQTVLKKFFYHYDAAGNRVNEQKNYDPLEAVYNNLNQLISLKPGGSILFQGEVNEPSVVEVNGQPAEIAGNQFEAYVKTKLGTNSIIITAKDAQNNIRTNVYQVLVTNEINTTLVYDLDGNLIMSSNQQFVATYQWDALSRLTQITSHQSQVTNNTEFTYNGLGRRIGILEKENDIVVNDKRFLWCGNSISEERNADNQVTKRFLSTGSQFINSQTQNSTNYYYTQDHLGSIREVIDEDGIVKARYDYDPWGRQTKIQGTLDADFGFTGHYTHKSSGLNLPFYRAYNSELGRWLSNDPIGELGGINLQTYAANNPVNYYDPDGQIPILAAIWIGAEILLLISDIYDTIETLSDPCASGGEQAFAVVTLSMSIFLPGGGYGKADDAFDLAKPLLLTAKSREGKSLSQVAKAVFKEGKLPDNFITKAQAQALGWNPRLGNLDTVAPGKCIGGDIFQNRGGLLPDDLGRIWYEADLNYNGGFRGSERLLYSSDGLVYYSGDHYQTFQMIGQK